MYVSLRQNYQYFITIQRVELFHSPANLRNKPLTEGKKRKNVAKCFRLFQRNTQIKASWRAGRPIPGLGYHTILFQMLAEKSPHFLAGIHIGKAHYLHLGDCHETIDSALFRVVPADARPTGAKHRTSSLLCPHFQHGPAALRRQFA